MGLPIFYTDPENINLVSGRAVLNGGEAKHAAGSLRVKGGDLIIIGDGNGNSYDVRVVSVDKVGLSGEIEASNYVERERPSINIYQAVSRPKHMEEAIVRNAETGVERLVPFVSERSPHNSLEKVFARKDRWGRIARESSKLSRRKWPLEIGEPLGSMIGPEELGRNLLNIVLWEDEADRGFSNVLPDESPESIGVVVGPEGGLSKSEVDLLESSGSVAASMGDLILRTESAGAYAAILIRFRYGNLTPGGRTG